jgi:hypothetical protein
MLFYLPGNQGMKKKYSTAFLLWLLLLGSLLTPVSAQRGRKQVIFAVLNAGKTLEPIAFIEKGTLTAPVGGDGEEKDLLAFTGNYYKPKSGYRLIFGGANAGTVTVVKSDPKSECAKNMAEISVSSTKTKLGGFVMALATDAVTKKVGSGTRRKPTWAERTAIDALVRAQFARQNITAAAIKSLNYHNLTAIDVNGDKQAELVGSFWVETAKTERALLFIIAEKNAGGKYEIVASEFKNVKQDEVMSGEIKALDTTGVYHELLLDSFDYDNDGSDEIFTYIQGFEGAAFNAYKREKGKWTKVYEGSNYHCGF